MPLGGLPPFIAAGAGAGWGKAAMNSPSCFTKGARRAARSTKSSDRAPR